MPCAQLGRISRLLANVLSTSCLLCASIYVDCLKLMPHSLRLLNIDLRRFPDLASRRAVGSRVRFLPCLHLSRVTIVDYKRRIDVHVPQISGSGLAARSVTS